VDRERTAAASGKLGSGLLRRPVLQVVAAVETVDPVQGTVWDVDTGDGEELGNIGEVDDDEAGLAVERQQRCQLGYRDGAVVDGEHRPLGGRRSGVVRAKVDEPVDAELAESLDLGMGCQTSAPFVRWPGSAQR